MDQGGSAPPQPPQGTSINFDAQALHDAEEAEFQREEDERQNEVTVYIFSIFCMMVYVTFFFSISGIQKKIVRKGALEIALLKQFFFLACFAYRQKKCK